MNKLNEEKQTLEAEINQLHGMINNNQAKIDNLVIYTPESRRKAQFLDSKILDLNERLEVKEGRLNQVNYDLELSELNYIKDQQTKRFEYVGLSIEAARAMIEATTTEAAEKAAKRCLDVTHNHYIETQADPEATPEMISLAKSIFLIAKGAHASERARATKAATKAAETRHESILACAKLDTADQLH